MASALTRPTNIVSTMPMAIQPSSVSTSGAASINMARNSDSRVVTCTGPVLDDTEGGEESIQDIIRGGFAGHAVDEPEGSIEIEQEHLVRNAQFGGALRLLESFARLLQQPLVADAGDEAVLGLDAIAR